MAQATNKHKNTSESSMNYHNSSNEENYSYDYKGNKGNYKRIHGKSVTANTSPIANTRHPTKKHMQSLNKSEIGFSQSQNCSPTLSKSHKFYQTKGKSSLPNNASYALAQIGKKTYVIPTNLSNYSDKGKKPSGSGGNYKGNAAYYDVLGYPKYSVPGDKGKKDSINFQNRLNLKMINEYEEKKAFSLVSSIGNSKKDDPINIRAMEHHIGMSKDTPLGVHDEQDLRLLMQQNKLIKGFNLDNLIMDGGTGGGNSKRVNNYIKGKSSKRSNSESGKIKGKKSIYSKPKSKKSNGNTKITKYFGGSRKNSKFKAIDMANLVKPDTKKGLSSKKYSPHPNEVRRKTNSVEPPSQDLRMISSPGGVVQYHRHNKSVNQQKNNIGSGKYKAKHYVMSQGNTELKQTLEKAKRKGKGLRSLHRSDISSLEHDDSSEYDIVRDIDQPLISKEMNVPTELYASYKRQKLISSALDTPISHFSKETSPQFVGYK